MYRITIILIKFNDEKERYYPVDDHGESVEPVLRFIRFKDNTNYAGNTLRMYCHHLKLYFEHLEQKEVETIRRLSLMIWHCFQLPSETRRSAQSHTFECST